MQDRKAGGLVARLISLLIVGLSLLWVGLDSDQGIAVQAVGAAQPTTLPTTVPITDTPTVTTTQFLPLINNDYTPLATRIGFGATRYPISRYPDVRQLQAGWYVDWAVQSNPVQPAGTEHAQLVNVHQKLACGEFVNGDRAACPYVQPLTYVYQPDQTTIEAAARTNPGQLWFIGNEMDRIDWLYCAEFEPDGRTCKSGKLRSGGQNEIVPETYAQAYHDLYAIIKTADPTARVAIGGVIQATPLRLQYLTLAWNAYQTQYGVDMPVDVWNVHNFILREQKNGYGAAIPPGLPGDPTVGAYVGNDCTHVDQTVFDQQIRAMRQWMKERGQQEKPLVVNEYGILFAHTPFAPNNDGGKCKINFNDETVVHTFMLWTFDYFLNNKDCSLGYTADECRLVQRWLWFSLDHLEQDANGNSLAGFNQHTSLFNGTTLQMRKAGELFKQFVVEHLSELHQ
ncbi:MAG: hypothetical protein M3Q45_15415 [Chloroflexota bacterium]|nr:hypothetical protein [Chloroflexota bacterium]